MTADRKKAIALRTRCGLIGVDPETKYFSAATEIPPGASLYLFSDGVSEFVTKEGVEWGLSDLVPYLVAPPVSGMSESKRLYQEVRALAQPGGLDDDFSLLVLHFD